MDSEGFLHFGTAKVEVSILQPEILGDRGLVLDWKGSRLGLTQDPQRVSHDFDCPGLQVWIGQPVLPPPHFPSHRDHKFRPQHFRGAVNFRMDLGAEDHLGDPFTVTQIDEDELAVVAPAIHPAHQKCILFFV